MNRLTAVLCLTASMVLVGSYVGLSKNLVVVFPIFLLAWLRFGMGGLAMLRWLKRPMAEPSMTAQTQRLVFLESFLGNFLFSICMLYGMSMTSAVAAGVILASIPACVALLSWLFLRERINLRVGLAVACGVLGIVLVSLSKTELTMQHNSRQSSDLATNGGLDNALLGNLLVFAAVLCEAAYAVIGKKLTGVMGPKRIASLINLVGFVLVTPLGIWQALRFDFAAVPAGAWGLLVFYAWAASVGSVWLWMTGLRSLPASQAGVFTVLLPVSTAAVGVAFLGETLGTPQLMAYGVALLGVLLATVPARKTSAAA